ncbi:putative fatty acyl-CoA reductase CG5065 [Leptinotarsa decemlineata]|uniref:putative fatty acyl-CoA reductase CG5065 n=1 Tax=Leptinotarsa decemlineata TaxID=7539 RepID=UPI003D30885B
MTSVAAFYEGKNVLVTGGSGFIGKVFIEKLLRCCPEVGNIYILLRSKKGKSIQERLSQIKDLPIFDVLKKSNSAALNKLIPINGDGAELQLGLSDEDRELLVNNVHIIVHTAASVRFDDSLKYAITLNVRGTREIVQLATEVKNLSVFVHISTTYCNTDRSLIEEKIYPAHADWREAIEIAETVDEEILNAMACKYISPLPNTYTFAKSLSEHVVEDMCKGRIPAIIIRPSVVVSTLEDPFPGWNDNFNGPTGLLVAGGKGVLRTVLGHPKSVQDFIPADLVVKLMLVATWQKAQFGDKNEIEVYHGSKNECTPIKIGEVVKMGADLVQDSPFSQILWYPNFSMTSCWYNYYIQVILFHIIPAIFLDSLLRLAGKKPMIVKIQRKIYIANVILEYFLKHSWKFDNKKSFSLINKLQKEDKETFGLSENILSWSNSQIFEFFKKGKIGAAMYILKEDFDHTRKESRKNLHRLWILDRITKVIFYGFVLYLFTTNYHVLKYYYNRLENYITNL